MNSVRLNKHALSCYYMPGILFSPVDVKRLLWVGNRIRVFPIIYVNYFMVIKNAFLVFKRLLSVNRETKHVFRLFPNASCYFYYIFSVPYRVLARNDV